MTVTEQAPTRPGPTPEQQTRVMVAADAVHAATCHRGAHEDSRKCAGWRYLVNWATLDAMDHLAANPRDAAGARAVLHDAVCYGGANCTPVGDHAKRTQSKTVAALRKYVLSGETHAVDGVGS